MIDPRRFINHENQLYILIRAIREEHKPNIDTWKEHLHADIVLRKDGILFFCELVPDIQDVEYLTEATIVVSETVV